MEYKLSNFEGPLDLLLHLLSKNKIEIADIFVSNIVDQFLEQVNLSDEQDLEEMSEFVYVSSRLLYIKSKKLLPNDKEEAKELEDEFLRQVFEYSKLKSVINDIKERYTAGYIEKPREFLGKEAEYNHEIYDIIKVAEQMFERNIRRLPPDEKGFAEIIDVPEIDVDTAIIDVKMKLSVAKKMYFSEFFEKSRQYAVTMFLALLMLCKDEYITLEQNFDDITIKLR